MENKDENIIDNENAPAQKDYTKLEGGKKKEKESYSSPLQDFLIFGGIILGIIAVEVIVLILVYIVFDAKDAKKDAINKIYAQAAAAMAAASKNSSTLL